MHFKVKQWLGLSEYWKLEVRNMRSTVKTHLPRERGRACRGGKGIKTRKLDKILPEAWWGERPALVPVGA